MLLGKDTKSASLLLAIKSDKYQKEATLNKKLMPNGIIQTIVFLFLSFRELSSTCFGYDLLNFDL